MEAGDGGNGSGHIGSTAAEPGGVGWPAVGAGGAADCFRAWRGDDAAAAVEGGFGLDAAAAAAPGTTGPEGSAFMMLTAGIEAAVGKSKLIGLRGAGAACGNAASASAPSDAALQSVA